MKKLHGLKKAVGDYQKNHKQFLCVIYLDTNDGMVWTDVFRDASFLDRRHVTDARSLNTYVQDATGDIKVSMQSIRKTAEYVRAKYAQEVEQ